MLERPKQFTAFMAFVRFITLKVYIFSNIGKTSIVYVSYLSSTENSKFEKREINIFISYSYWTFMLYWLQLKSAVAPLLYHGIPNI